MRRARGFTILEVLVATLLVGIGFFAIMSAFNRSIFGVGEAEDYALALLLTQERLEELQDTAFATIIDQAKAPVTGFADLQREVDVTDTHPDLKQVIVTTYWTVPNGENNVSLSTYVVNN